MAKRKVVIVNAGGAYDLSAAKGSYDGWVETLVASVKDDAEVKVITDPKEIDVEVANGAKTVLFVTSGMRRIAEATKRAHSRVRVIICTGLIPDDVVVWMNKVHLTDALVKNLLLDKGGPY